MSADLFGATVTLYGGSARAYAGRPGSGPPGKTCADCEHCHAPARPNPKARFLKCALVKSTHGKGTDIRARTAACSHFQPEEASK